MATQVVMPAASNLEAFARQMRWTGVPLAGGHVGGGPRWEFVQRQDKHDYRSKLTVDPTPIPGGRSMPRGLLRNGTPGYCKLGGARVACGMLRLVNFIGEVLPFSRNKYSRSRWPPL